MPNNLYDKIKSLESEMNRIIKMVSDIPQKKEEPKQVFKPTKTRLDSIDGLLKPMAAAAYIPSHSPRNFSEQIILIDSASGTDTLYINVNGTWRYVNLT